MVGRDERRVGRSLASAALPLVVLAVAVTLAVVLWRGGDLNRFICDGDCGPSNVIAPTGLTAQNDAAETGVDAAPAGRVDGALLEAAVADALGSDALGPRSGFVALDPADGTVLASKDATATFTPASSAKVLTGFAALSLLDPDGRFATTVVPDGDSVVLVGGGDPYLATEPPERADRAIGADLTTLAERTAVALERDGTTSVALRFDDSLFTGPTASPDWEDSYVPENIVTPVSALWADQGIDGGLRAGDPAEAAAEVFSDLLEDEGITVTGDPTRGEAPDAAPLASVESATVTRIVESMLRTSNNETAEVMFRQAAIAAGEPATFEGGTTAVTAALADAGIDTEGLAMLDGSGLSRGSVASPTTLAQTVRVAATSSPASALLSDLPISGFTGTLARRFASLDDAQGLVRAKTGTLTGVHSLTGYATDAGGRPVVFAVMTDRTRDIGPLDTQAALDRVSAAITTCTCG